MPFVRPRNEYNLQKCVCAKEQESLKMKTNWKTAFVLICLAQFVCLSCQSADGPANRWNTLMLWSNQVLSASLNYIPEASIADEDYMFIEFNNHTGKTLDVSQAWVNLPATRTDKNTQQFVLMRDMASGVIYFGKLPPGKTRTLRNGVFAAGLASLGLPPKTGYHVEVTPHAGVRLADGTVFSGAHEKFSFEFNYPNPTEVESIKTRFKQLLARPDNQFESGALLTAFSQLPEVRDSLTLDEVLSALKSRSWVDGKAALMTIVGSRFANEPKVLAHFVEQLSHDDGDAFFSFPREVWQNPVFVEPLVKRYERHGNNSRELWEVRSVWINMPEIVARLSTALLKNHPTLSRNVAELSGDDLCNWRSGVLDACMIGNTNLLQWLEPALADKRIVPDCISEFDSRPRSRWKPRICDCAAGAVLMIVDGDSWTAFKEAGIESWDTQEEYYAAHDRVIADLIKRLRLIKDSEQ
jgi:hypothetical protein